MAAKKKPRIVPYRTDEHTPNFIHTPTGFSDQDPNQSLPAWFFGGGDVEMGDEKRVPPGVPFAPENAGHFWGTVPDAPKGDPAGISVLYPPHGTGTIQNFEIPDWMKMRRGPLINVAPPGLPRGPLIHTVPNLGPRGPLINVAPNIGLRGPLINVHVPLPTGPLINTGTAGVPRSRLPRGGVPRTPNIV